MGATHSGSGVQIVNSESKQDSLSTAEQKKTIILRGCNWLPMNIHRMFENIRASALTAFPLAISPQKRMDASHQGGCTNRMINSSALQGRTCGNGTEADESAKACHTRSPRSHSCDAGDRMESLGRAKRRRGAM
uniref:Uncharacterized protein n=1 Tax=Steinernema glaseri TaxID=37863 RepID=A0A1I7Y0T6_9BILA